MWNLIVHLLKTLLSPMMQQHLCWMWSSALGAFSILYEPLLIPRDRSCGILDVRSPRYRHLQLAGLSGMCKLLLLLSGLVASLRLGVPGGHSLEIMLP
jgi:hypothetical protein